MGDAVALDAGARALAVADFDVDRVGDVLALVVDAEDPPAQVDAGVRRAGRGLPRDPVRIVELGAGDGVDIAGDQRGRAVRSGELGLHAGVDIAEQLRAAAQLRDVEIAQPEMVDAVEILVVAVILRVFECAHVGEHAVLAEHQRQRLVKPGAVAAAREAVELRRGGVVRQADIGGLDREQRVHDHAADHVDRQRGAGGPEAGQPERRQHKHRRRDHRQRADDAPEAAAQARAHHDRAPGRRLDVERLQLAAVEQHLEVDRPAAGLAGDDLLDRRAGLEGDRLPAPAVIGDRVRRVVEDQLGHR